MSKESERKAAAAKAAAAAAEKAKQEQQQQQESNSQIVPTTPAAESSNGEQEEQGTQTLLPSLEYKDVSKKFVFLENGELEIAKDAIITAAEYEAFIVEENKGAEAKSTRCAFALHFADKQGIKKEVFALMLQDMSKSAADNINNLCNIIPYKLQNGFKAPLTVLKDAMGAMRTNSGDRVFGKDGKIFVTLDSLNEEATKLLPALQNGIWEDGSNVSQSSIRKMRAELEKAKQAKLAAEEEAKKAAEEEAKKLQQEGEQEEESEEEEEETKEQGEQAPANKLQSPEQKAAAESKLPPPTGDELLATKHCSWLKTIADECKNIGWTEQEIKEAKVAHAAIARKMGW